MTDPMPDATRLLPPDDALRSALHDEVHARPWARIRLPARLLYVAVLNEGVSREQEWQHLCHLPGQQALPAQALQANFLQLALAEGGVQWERHSEFTRYTVLSPWPVAPHAGQAIGAVGPSAAQAQLPEGWLAGIPGRTVAAIELLMLVQPLDDPRAALAAGNAWLDQGPEGPVVASLMGGGHSCVVTDFRRRPDGFERLVVLAPPDTTPPRAGRISQRLLEMETYRLMALRGLPAAKALSPMLQEAEAALADTMQHLDDGSADDAALLQQLTALAARVERATAANGYRFSATQAYDELVRQRLAELREKPIHGTQTLGAFMRRRLSPAMATVSATERRLTALSQRIERAGALLRTRVDIASEAQNQELLARLTRGQALQLRLQSTVEGLSIAAISYYVVSLLLYGGKAAKGAGLPINPELVAGAAIPLVLWGVWRTVRRIHERLHRDEGH